MSILIRILANSLAILIATRLVPGFVFSGDILNLLIAGAVIGLINALIKPIVQILSFPFILLTLGLFNILINIFLLFLAAKFLPHLNIQTLWAAFWGVVIISLTNYIISHLSKPKEDNK
jgi:putative membrane protein